MSTMKVALYLILLVCVTAAVPVRDYRGLGPEGLEAERPTGGRTPPTLEAITGVWQPTVTRLNSAYCQAEAYSRLDAVPCSYRPNSQFPEPNEYGLYRTKISLGGDGNPTCRVRNPDATHVVNEAIRPISTLGSPNLRLLFSPGFMLNEQYGNQVLVNYSIQCPGTSLAFFNLSLMQVEGECDGQCVDYISVDRGSFGTTESCGNEMDENTLQLERGSFNMLFRTSLRRRYPGFEFYVICFHPNTQSGLNRRGCTRPGGEDSALIEQQNSQRQRNLENFQSQMQQRVHRSLDILPVAPRLLEISVAYGESLQYCNNDITILRSQRVITRIRNVRQLETLDRNGIRRTYTGSASYSTRFGCNSFSGPGPLTVTSSNAYFQMFIFAPWSFSLTSAEEEALATITQGLFATLSPEEDLDIDYPDYPEEFEQLLRDLEGNSENPNVDIPPHTLPPPPPPRYTLPPPRYTISPPQDKLPPPRYTISPPSISPPERVFRQRRRAAPISLPAQPAKHTLVVHSVQESYRNQNACNPVLQTAASSTMNLVRAIDPVLVQRIGQELELE